MAISTPSIETLQWGIDLNSQDWNSISNSLRTIKVDEHFPAKVCSFIEAMKATNAGTYYHDYVGEVLDCLDENPELEFIGAGSFSACFKTKDNTVYKFNILGESIDAFVSYAIHCHDNKSPFAPVVNNVCHYNQSYCIETELLTSFQRSTYTYGNLNTFDEIITNKDYNKFFQSIKQLVQSEVEGKKPSITLSSCTKFIEMIHSSIQAISGFRTKPARLDSGIDNLMWRGNQIVFNDPIF
jgi:hypothetical protein